MLSMKAKYAIRALMVLAANEGRTLQSKTIAKEAVSGRQRAQRWAAPLGA